MLPPTTCSCRLIEFRCIEISIPRRILYYVFENLYNIKLVLSESFESESTISLNLGHLSTNLYCTNSVNSAGHVTRYTAAEMKISAPRQNDRYIHFFSADDHFSQDYYCKLPAEAAYLKKQL